MGPPCYFIDVKRSKILQKLNKRDCFFNIHHLIFYGVSCAKTDLHSKYISNFVSNSFFKQDLPLNVFILEIYGQRWPKCAHISKTETEDNSIERSLSEKKNGVQVSFWKKSEALYAELNKRVQAATNSYYATDEFLQYIYSVLVTKNHQKIQSMCFVHQFFFTGIFLNSVLYGCGVLLLLWKRTQSNAHCITPP